MALLDHSPTTHCADGAECRYFKEFREHKFTEAGNVHLTTLAHPLTPCRYKRDCYAHKRLCNGGRAFKDRCHCCTFSHGRAERAELPGGLVPLAKNGSFHLEGRVAGEKLLFSRDWNNSAISDPEKGAGSSGEALSETIAERLERDGPELIRAELKEHGLEDEMRMLTEVVPGLREHPRLAEAESAFQDQKRDVWPETKNPILDIELFAILLYTGTEAQGMIRWALRQREQAEAERWYWTIQAIRVAVLKLAESPPEQLFHGLNGVVLREEDYQNGDWAPVAFGYANFISTSMSKEMATTFALGAGGTVPAGGSKNIGTVLCFNPGKTLDGVGNTLGNSFSFQEEIAYADLRWISKFPDEQEWLMIPLSRMNAPSIDVPWGDPQGKKRPFPTSTEKFKVDDGDEQIVNFHECYWLPAVVCSSTQLAQDQPCHHVADNVDQPETTGIFGVLARWLFS